MYTERTASAGTVFAPFQVKRKVINYRRQPDIIDISAEAMNRYTEYRKAQEMIREQQIRDKALEKLVYVMTEGIEDRLEPAAASDPEKKFSRGTEKLCRILFG